MFYSYKQLTLPFCSLIKWLLSTYNVYYGKGLLLLWIDIYTCYIDQLFEGRI